MTHDLKTVQPHFGEIRNGNKTAELRLNDRNFAIGDLLTLREFDPRTGRYSDQIEVRKVTHILTGKDLPAVLSPRFVIMSIAPLPPAAVLT